MDYPEQWKQYDDKYWVSDLGRVKRVYKNGNVHYLKAVPRNSADTQPRVKLYRNYVAIRRLVWKVFNGPIPEGYAVVNKNGCHTMNELYNLALIPLDESKGTNKYSRRKPIIDLDTGKVYASSRIAEKYLYMTKTALTRYCNGKTKNPIYNLEFFNEDKEYKQDITFVKS